MKKFISLLFTIIFTFQSAALISFAADGIELSSIINSSTVQIKTAGDIAEFSIMLHELKSKFDEPVNAQTNAQGEAQNEVQGENGSTRLIVKADELSSSFGAKEAIGDGDGFYVLQYTNEKDAENVFDYLSKLRQIKSVSFDKPVSVSAATNPLEQSPRNRNGAKRVESDRFKKAIAKKAAGKQVVVAVVDTGVWASHPMLKSRIINKGFDFIDNDKVPNDTNMHGTHCSGIIVDNTPDNVKILPIKVFNSDGYADDSTIVLGIKYAIKNGANVISMSFGGEGESKVLQSAIKQAVSAGITCVAAAGNDADDTKNYYPASYDECITVAAIDENDCLADFSNFGKCVDICAPGVDIWSSSLKELGSYSCASGTSMAAPFVSAAAAMLKLENSSLTPCAIEKPTSKGSC